MRVAISFNSPKPNGYGGRQICFEDKFDPGPRVCVGFFDDAWNQSPHARSKDASSGYRARLAIRWIPSGVFGQGYRRDRGTFRPEARSLYRVNVWATPTVASRGCKSS